MRFVVQSGLVVTLLGLSSPALAAPCETASPLQTRYAAWLDSRLPQTPASPALDPIADQLRQRLCTAKWSSPWLANACDSAAPAGLVPLRRRLLLDAASAPTRALATASTPDRAAAGVAVAAALLQVLLTRPDLPQLVDALQGQAPCANAAFAPGVSVQVGVAPPQLERPLRLLRRLLDTPPTGPLSDERLAELTQAALERIPTPAELQSARRLATAVAQERELWTATTELEALVRAELALLVDAAEALLAFEGVALPSGVKALVLGLPATRSAGDAAKLFVTAGLEERVEVPQPARSALELAVLLADVRSEEQLKRALKSWLLPPWIGGLMLDVNAGVPVLKGGEFNVDLSGTVGWEASRWGAWAQGARRAYDAELPGRDLLETQLGFAAGGWFNFQDIQRSPLGLSVGTELGYDNYVSQLTVLDATGTASEDHSTLLRASLSASLWWKPDPDRVFLRVHANSGLHTESYQQTTAIARGPDAGLRDASSSSVAGDQRLRAVLAWRVVPSWLRATVLLRGRYLQLTRTHAVVSYDFNRSFAEQNSAESTARLEAESSLLLDLEALEVGNWLRPGAFAALQYVRTSTPAGSTELLTPVFGLGLRSYLPQ